jgi:dTDP-4-amino-4,6-dideoxygalactose transaminase
VVVHLYGVPSAVEEIVAVARAVGLPVVEDCAQAHGAHIEGRKVGSFGAASTFSFYPTKNLGGIGDGGAVATNDAAIAERVVETREYGWDKDRCARGWGMNSRLDEIQAAVLRKLLPHLDEDNEQRRRAAALYCERLAEARIETPIVPAGAVFHQFVLEVPDRDRFAAALTERGIGTAVHYTQGLHQQPRFRSSATPLPVTERLASRVISLPIQPEIFWPASEVICDAVASALQ